MKRVIFAVLMMVPAVSMASSTQLPVFGNMPNLRPELTIPAQFSISGETKTLEWGCPIDNEHIKGDNQKMVLNQLISECSDQVSQAAKEKPEVAAVLQTSVIAPDLAIKDEGKGVHLVNGTIFLETVVTLAKAKK